MQIQIKKAPYLIILGVVALAAVSLVGAKVIRGQKNPPHVACKARGVEVVSVTLQEEPVEALAVEIRNVSGKPIIAVTLESRAEKEASGINHNGFRDGDEPPEIVLYPYQSTVIRLSASDLVPGGVLQVGAVMYADGTEEGDDRTLNTMRGQREHYRHQSPKNKAEGEPQ
jgi:hypothetical protein